MRFIHIVLTDGADTSSKTSIQKLKEVFIVLEKEMSDLCTTFFIGIGLGYKEKQELNNIVKLGSKSTELLNCTDIELGDVFDRIKILLDTGSKQQLSEKKCLVLFTLDISNSMAGGRWNRVVGAVQAFCQAMTNEDILGCILFNHKINKLYLGKLEILVGGLPDI